MADKDPNTIQEDLGSVIIQAAEVLGSKEFIKAHVQITVASDQYKMFSGEVNLSQGANVDPNFSGEENRAALLSGVLNTALVQAEELKERLVGWRRDLLSEPTPEAQAPKTTATPKPARPPAGSGTPGRPTDRNVSTAWGLLAWSPRVTQLNYGDTFSVVADYVRKSSDGRKLEFMRGDNPRPALEVSGSSSGALSMWNRCFPDYDFPGDGQTGATSFGTPKVIFCEATRPPQVVPSTQNPFINITQPGIDYDPAMGTPVTPDNAQRVKLPQAVPGYEEI